MSSAVLYMYNTEYSTVLDEYFSERVAYRQPGSVRASADPHLLLLLSPVYFSSTRFSPSHSLIDRTLLLPTEPAEFLLFAPKAGTTTDTYLPIWNTYLLFVFNEKQMLCNGFY